MNSGMLGAALSCLTDGLVVTHTLYLTDTLLQPQSAGIPNTLLSVTVLPHDIMKDINQLRGQ